MKSLRKYAILAALAAAAVVEAQNAKAPKLPSTEEMAVRSGELKKQVTEDMRHVLHLQAKAKNAKDVIKLTCINDKLVQLKAHENLFDTAVQGIEGAADSEGAHSHFVEVETEAVEVKKLRGEADGCAGELEMYKQESRTDVDRPQLDDPTDGEPFHDPEQMGDPDIEVPGFTTPYR